MELDPTVVGYVRPAFGFINEHDPELFKKMMQTDWTIMLAQCLDTGSEIIANVPGSHRLGLTPENSMRLVHACVTDGVLGNTLTYPNNIVILYPLRIEKASPKYGRSFGMNDTEFLASLIVHEFAHLFDGDGDEVMATQQAYDFALKTRRPWLIKFTQHMQGCVNPITKQWKSCPCGGH